MIDVLRQNKVRDGGRLCLDGRDGFSEGWNAFTQPPAPGATVATLSFAIGASMLPHCESVRLSRAFVKLDRGTGVTIPSGVNFALLAIGSRSYPLAFSADGIAPFGPIGLDGPNFLGPWAITVPLGDPTPESLLNDSAVDPGALLNFELILDYSADVPPPV